MLQQKVSCIIPAYNEGKRIGNVLRIVDKHPLIKEIIVIDDGSKDDTLSQIKKFKGIHLIVHKKNKGKSWTMMDGIAAAKGPLVLFLDSDLIGLTKENLSRLIKPVQEGKSDISISLRKNSPWYAKIIGLDFISGERVMNKRLLYYYKDFKKLTGFGIESYMNKHIIKEKNSITVVNWDNVESPYPQAKIGRIKGTIRLLGMAIQIMKTIGWYGPIYQNIRMLRLKVKNS